MSSVEAPRRSLTERQAQVVQRLTDAAVAQIRATGYDGLTVRNVAARAGVAPATAYTYFASKDHLIAEAFWRRIRELPQPRIDKRRVELRVKAALKDLTAFLAAEPELAAASTTAMLASDPDVKRIRDRVGAYIRRRLELALADDDGEQILMALDLAVGGAMIRAGMGHLDYAELPERVAEIAGLLLKGR
ncbi:MAG TPA: TetR family transcriptional regulator [Actinomycetota bacterium]|nr:TetR family transcriptional regulator [Actinomycetota bacterium]